MAASFVADLGSGFAAKKIGEAAIHSRRSWQTLLWGRVIGGPKIYRGPDAIPAPITT